MAVIFRQKERQLTGNQCGLKNLSKIPYGGFRKHTLDVGIFAQCGFILSIKKKCSLDLSIEYVIDEQSIINCAHS